MCYGRTCLARGRGESVRVACQAKTEKSKSVPLLGRAGLKFAGCGTQPRQRIDLGCTRLFYLEAV
jgi:hypothetical protein